MRALFRSGKADHNMIMNQNDQKGRLSGMRKKAVLFTASILVFMIAGILIFTRQKKDQFTEERISSTGCFGLRFERMNMTDPEAVMLSKDDRLHVSWQIERCLWMPQSEWKTAERLTGHITARQANRQIFIRRFPKRDHT